MKRHNVRRLLALVLVAALCLLCGAAAQPNAKEIHIYSADDLVQLSKSCKLTRIRRARRSIWTTMWT